VGARWAVNLGLYGLGWLFTSSVLSGIVALANGVHVPSIWPLFGAAGWHDLGGLPTLLAGCLLIDAVGYTAHRLSHTIPLLWRCHAVHHSEVEVDVSTGIRHHPFENLFTSMMGGAAVALVELPLWVVAVYTLILVTAQITQHANLVLPAKLDDALRTVFCTPGHHRVHHSIDAREGNSNFGVVFSFWDRILGTFVAAPRDGAAMVCGVAGLADSEWRRPLRVLLTPFLLPRPQTPQE
jgi:sterol desaturase/sphingolipid hydroxylase (fatty acid hydroxylase superfamily)